MKFNTNPDSVRPLDNHSRIHSRMTGRLHKGHGMTAATSSIPTKYQTIVTSNTDKKGFTMQAKRFVDNLHMTDTPGPGNYQFSHQEIEKQSTSFSKKGTGGLASKTSRTKKVSSIATPSAASYSLPSLLTTRKEFNRAHTTSCFHSPIAVNTDYLQKGTKRVPAPNQYNIEKIKLSKNTVIPASSAFKSKTNRQSIPVGSLKVPSPCHYNIQEDGKDRGPTAAFHSKTKRGFLKPGNVPGPGTYKPHEPVDPTPKQLFPRKHYLCISAPAMPLPPALPAPGPGAYEVVDYEGPAKHYMSSGVFVSNTSRWTLDHLPTKDNPGPSSYRPEKLGRQSFLYNAQNRWIPC